MSLAIRFTEHEEFHRETFQAIVAAGLVALATHTAGLVFPSASIFAHGGPWALSGLGVAATYAVTARSRPGLSWLLKVVGAGIAGAIAMILMGRESGEPALGFACWAACFGVLLASGQRGTRWLVVAGGTIAALLVGRYVTDKVFAATELHKVPPFVRATIGGLGFGIITAVGAATRYLSLRQDPARAAFQAAAPKLTGELRDLAERAHATHTRIEEVLESRSGERAEATARQIRESSGALVIQICSIGTQWTEVEAEGARTSPESVAARLAALDAKLAATTDSIAREQYNLARGSLIEQQRYLGELATGRERVVARTHANLAALEKLRLAVVNLRSVDAQRLASGVQPLLDEIRNLSTEFDIRSQATSEAEDFGTSSSPAIAVIEPVASAPVPSPTTYIS